MSSERIVLQFALFAVLAALLSGCGVDGEPKPPAKPAGVSISGDARVGVSN